ncbi:MAG TPA: (2Fe-2S) ferredoxin domain-containing protein [Clostridiaceae bacterium]|jgi:NADP-reducing hydrogenase subunit HndB|nr:(2Fe-2S) ferredoxin domain-containing protein [Clostridiaceae bacterium]
MKSLAELEAIRNKAQEQINLRKNKDGMRVVVGMATCGIAAGARPVMNAFMEELKKRNIDNVVVTMTGCMGVCRLEPMAEIIDTNGKRFTYVKLTSEKVRRIVAEHIVNGKPVIEYTIGQFESKN